MWSRSWSETPRRTRRSRTGDPRSSILDLLELLELLDIDGSFAACKELATELGYPADLMGDSAKLNMWLHKTVPARIAANGGKVPKELLD
jgi:hypothetical protein